MPSAGESWPVGNLNQRVRQEVLPLAAQRGIFGALETVEHGRPLVGVLRSQIFVIVDRLPDRVDPVVDEIVLGLIRTWKGADPLPRNILVRSAGRDELLPQAQPGEAVSGEVDL